MQNEVEEKSCYEVCKILQQNQHTDLCNYPHFCSGGCRIACEENEDDFTGNEILERFEVFRRQGCQISWEIATEIRRNVAFILAGQDYGNMWHLIAGNLTVSEFDLDAALGTIYPKLVIIAVDERQVLDSLMVNLPRYMECQEEVSSSLAIETDLLVVIILSVIVVVLFFILIVVVFCLKPKRSSQSGTENLDRLVAAKQRRHELEKVSLVLPSKLSSVKGTIV